MAPMALVIVVVIPMYVHTMIHTLWTPVASLALGPMTRPWGKQTYQVSRISRETHAFRPTLTLTRPRTEISRMAVNVTHILTICVKYPRCARDFYTIQHIITLNRLQDTIKYWIRTPEPSENRPSTVCISNNVRVTHHLVTRGSALYPAGGGLHLQRPPDLQLLCSLLR